MAASSKVFGRGCRVLMAAAKSSAAATAAHTAASTAAAANVAPRGLMKPLRVSPALGAFLGVSEASRSDVVKKVWQHIKLNNLQNPQNKKEIICDEKLKTIFDGKDKVGFLEIAKLLKPHFVAKWITVELVKLGTVRSVIRAVRLVTSKVGKYYETCDF
ncbi:hypothetical protein CsSME_00049501 [Camellia sinensis var. sinensis]